MAPVTTAGRREVVAQQFPITHDRSYFDVATYGPMPVAGIEAQTAFLKEVASGGHGPGVGHWWTGVDLMRAKVGGLINARPGDICFLKSTSEGLGLPVLGLDWAPGDEVITYDYEFLSVVEPLRGLRDQGVNVRFVEDRGRLRYDVEDVAALIGPRTRAIFLSLVNFSTGFRAPIEEISRLCRERGIWLVVDAVQAIGVLQVDVEALGADLVSAHGYKALCAGYGISLCYVSPRLQEALTVPVPGWKSIEDVMELKDLTRGPDDVLRLAHGARRFESGVPNLGGMYAMGASIDLFTDLGIAAIEEHVLAVSARVAATVAEHGYRVASSTTEGERSGIVAFECPGDDPARVVAALADARVHAAVREGRVRCAAHVLVDDADVARLDDALTRMERAA
ncbi:aminotransferase class V-fold PLP-dependent enzyme [Nocardioides carbamazepini]|uniref:aminotransferase class V-fold PLP-dependent enzyme n=1 Tax=Nocardioides carbamazepini TaxID=2854259 RepID=UPI00214A4439|nr:aminotransferase class V-fold PLP-dependent enzyme [Nocardioides carbamazepini]MCR1786136.1 aminotransferase class V-fold PLP-dependent enzyme [Nocardioides carbamazepini]